VAELPPFLPFFAGALLLPILPRGLRGIFFLVPPALAMWTLSGMQDGSTLSITLLGWELTPLRVDRLALLFGWVFAIVAFIGGVYALHLRSLGQQVAASLYAGSALGAVFAGDLITLLVFWEIMALGSAWLVWSRRTPASLAAGMRYIYVHLAGGGLLMAGILLHAGDTGSLAFTAFAQPSPAAWLILLGFGINAAIPPLHAWLPDAYPQATVTGAVFMSAFTTKTAVYALARGFAGWELLVPFGVAMTLYGVVYATLANDIRRLLAYHIVSQVGYMVAGVGLGSQMGINGATAHAFTHILYKGLLFMGAGAVLHATARSKLTELGGLGRFMPWTVALYLVGAFSISGFPLFSGFVSKAVTVDAAAKLGRDGVVLLLHLASIGTFLSTTLKLPYFTWWGPRRAYELVPIPWNMTAGMALAAGLNIFLGVYPQALYAILPYPLDYHPYTHSHLVKSAQLLGFTFLAFWLLRSRMGGKPRITLDTDWLYRRPAGLAYRLTVVTVDRLFGGVEALVLRMAEPLRALLANPHKPAGGLLRTIARLDFPIGGADPEPACFDVSRYRFSTGGVLFVLLLVFALLLAGALLVA